MQYTTLGKTGMRVSRICLGTMTFGWRVDEATARAIIDRAIALGINFFDTANVYGRGRSEEVLGAAVKDKRDEVIIASKVFWSFKRPDSSGLSRAFVFAELAESLARLQTDYLDLYYAHRFDPKVGHENILKTLNIAIDQRKVLHIGASTMYTWEFMHSLWVADKLGLEPFQVMQPHYNLLYREEEREMLPMCQAHGIAVAPWGPLAKGVLSGKYLDGSLTDGRASADEGQHWFRRTEDTAIVERVVQLAKDKGVTPAQIALAWLLHKDAVTAPVVGVSSIAQLEQVVAATEITLTDQEMNQLEERYQPRHLTGHYAGVPVAGDPVD